MSQELKKPHETWIASFDIGKKNFAFYIEATDSTMLSDLRCHIRDVLPEHRYASDGSPSSQMQSVIDGVAKCGRTIAHVNVDITVDAKTRDHRDALPKRGRRPAAAPTTTPPKTYLDPEIYINMVEHLDKFKNLLDLCDFVVIEAQMKSNTMALKLGQHCYSYFCIKYGRAKTIVEFPAYYKTVTLGARKLEAGTYKNGRKKWKTMDKPARKKWAVEMATNILSIRGEIDTISNIKSKSKKDDLADTVCQLSAFKIHKFVFESTNP